MPSDKQLSLTVVFTDPTGTEKVAQNFKGTAKEIQKQLDNLNVKQYANRLLITNRELDRARRSWSRIGSTIRNGNSATISVLRTTKELVREENKLGTVRFKQKGVTGKNQNTTAAIRKRIEANKDLVNSETKVRDTTVRTARATTNLGKQVQKAFRSQQTNLLNRYRTKMAAVSKQIGATGDMSGVLGKRLKMLREGFTELSQKNVKDVIPNFDTITEDQLEGALDNVKAFTAEASGEFQTLSSVKIEPTIDLSQKGNKFGSSFRAISQQLSGAVGFGLVEAGVQIQKIFEDRRLKGQLTSGVKSIFGTIGSAFGSAIGSISADIGNAAGQIAELFINLLTVNIRIAGKALGGVVRGLGFLIISGFAVTAVSGGLGIIASSIATLGPALILGALVPLTFAVISFITDLVSEVLDIINKIFKAITSLITAGIKTITLVVKSGLKLIATIWSAAWKGIKDIAKATWEGIVEFSKAGLDLTVKLISKGISAFVQLQTGAIKAAKEIADSGNNIVQVTSEVNAIRVNFGFDQKDTAAAFFDVVSSGYRDTAERLKIVRESTRLAIADQSSLANATNALITVFSNYGSETLKLSKISKLLSTATTLGRTSLEELGPALRNVIGIAKVTGVSLEDLLTSVTALTRVFGRGSTRSVTRFLSRFFEAISNPTSRARKSFEELGVSINDLGDGDFSDKFVVLLEKLKGISSDRIRDFFPTIQSRRAFIGLTQDVEKFKKILAQVRGLQSIQGQQIALIFKTAAQRIKVVAQVLEVARENLGKLFVDFARVTILSDKFFTLFRSIGDVLSSELFTKGIRELAKVLAIVIAPLQNVVLRLFQNLKVILTNLASIDILKDSRTRPILEDILNISKSFKAIIGDAQIFENVSAGINTALDLGVMAIGKFEETLGKIASGDITFQTIKDDLEEIGVIIKSLAFENIVKGLSKLTLGVDVATSVVSGIDIKDALGGVELTKPQEQIFNSFATLFRAVSDLGKAIFNELINQVGGGLQRVFLNTTNIMVERLRFMMSLVLVMGKMISDVEFATRGRRLQLEAGRIGAIIRTRGAPDSENPLTPEQVAKMSANMQRLQKELSAWRIQNAMGERDPTMLDDVVRKGMELLRRDEERNPQFPIGESPTDKKARLATQEANAEQRKNDLAELLVGVQERIDAQTKALLETDPAKAKDSLIAAGKTSFAKNKILASEGDRDIPIIELQNKIADKLQKIEDAFQARKISEGQRDRLKAGNLKGFERQRDALVRKQMTEMFNSLVDKGISLGEAFDATVEKFDASGVSLQGRKTFAENLAKSRVATDEKFNREDLRGVNANQRARRARERALEIRNAKQRKAEADRKAKEAKEAQLRDPRKRKGAALFVPDVEIKANEVSSRVVNMEPPKVRFAGSRGSLGSRGDTGALGSGQGVSRRTMSVDVEAFKRERSFSRVMNDAAKATAKETERLFNKMDRQQGLMPDFTNDSQPMPAGASERLFRILDEVNRQNDFDRVMDDSVQPTAREIQGLFDKLSTINDERDKVFKKLKLPSIGVSLAKANEPVVDAITGLELLPIGIPSGDQSRRTQDLFENNNLIKTGGPTSEDIDFAVRNFAEGLLKFAPGGINNRGFGRATGGNNPGFNGLGPIRNENPFRTRSGRLKSTRRGARTSAAGFFSRPSALPRGVVRNRRGTSLFEREQSNRPGTTGTRFSGQTAQGLLAARRRRTDGVTPSMVQREAPKAKDTQSQTFAQEANTVALDANKQATEANTAAVREVPATLAKAVLGAFGVPFPGSNNPGDTDVANNTPAKGSGFGVT